MHCVGKSLAIMAVIQYKGDVSSIVDAINAIPLHLGANDNNARKNHKLCPFAENSWCKYQLAIWHQEPVPHHPNYLSEQAVTYNQGLFTNYKYNDPDFVRKISDGRTSNNNEALHHVLFQMVRKNEQVSNTIMRLGSALAVIKKNNGFSGIRELSDMQEIPVSNQLADIFAFYDERRASANLHAESAIKKRFVKRQMRTQTRRDKFSGAQKTNTDESGSDEGGANMGDAVASTTQVSSPLDKECCVVCLVKIPPGVEEIGLGMTENLSQALYCWYTRITRRHKNKK